MSVKHLDHLNMTVKNLEESVQWYGNVFGFKKVEEGDGKFGRWAILRSGDAILCLYESPRVHSLDETGRLEHNRHGVNHFGFRILDREVWEQTVAEHGVDVRYEGRVEWPHSVSWYVVDPTGHEIEVVLWDEDMVRFAPVAA